MYAVYLNMNIAYGLIVVPKRVQVKYYFTQKGTFVYLHKYGGKFMGKLYETIQTLCDQRGIKPGKLCADLGLSRGLMTDLKMDRRSGVNAQTADKIAQYFGVSVGYLLGTEEKQDVLEEIDLAFYGEYKQLTAEQQETIRDMVRVMRQRRERG